jgi:hypothetical protein
MRTVATCLAFALLSALSFGCGPDGPTTGGAAKGGTRFRADVAEESGPSARAPVEKATAAGPPAAKSAALAEAVTGTDKSSRWSRTEKGPQSGLLTAGSFDDNIDPRFFRSFLDRVAQNPGLAELPDRLRGHRLVVHVKDGGGSPVGNARVRITSAQGGPAVDLTTRSDGRVVFLSSWDQVDASGDLRVTVTPPDGSPPVEQVVPRGAPRWEVVAPSARAAVPRNLDLALVLDTTGSMADELEYLKSEIRSIAAAVHEKFPQVNQRYALVLYRDEGDEYVTRPFDFTPSLEEFRKNLAAQRAKGGGDEPEAMHRALEEAAQLRWRADDTARVVFLVTDAPPHAQFVGRTMAAANALRKQGVAIYPVACSGYGDAAEVVLRACAMLTGSQFLFLTDDSGVGNAHAEPHIPFYHVEKLDRLLIRMIAAELSGQRLQPEPGEILRTVGKPIN